MNSASCFSSLYEQRSNTAKSRKVQLQLHPKDIGFNIKPKTTQEATNLHGNPYLHISLRTQNRATRFLHRQTKKPGRHTTKKEYTKFEREAVYNGGAYACDDLRAGQTVSVFSRIEFGLPVYRIYFRDGLSIFVPEEDLNFPLSTFVFFSYEGSDPGMVERNGESAYIIGYHQDADNELVHDLLFRDGFTCSAKTKDLFPCALTWEIDL